MNRSIVWILGIVVILIATYVLMQQSGTPSSVSESPTINSADQTVQANATSTQPSGQNNNTMNTDKLTKEDLVVGSGIEAKTGDKVTVNYVGTLTNGTKFDASADHGQPFEFTLGKGEVIQGWDEGVVGMKVGGKRKLTIPASLAYGDQAIGAIPANSTLVFEIELLKVNGQQ